MNLSLVFFHNEEQSRASGRFSRCLRRSLLCAAGLAPLVAFAGTGPVVTPLFFGKSDGTGDHVRNEPVGTTYQSFGIPAINNNEDVAFAADLKTTQGRTKALLAGNPLQVFLRQGNVAPGSGGATFRTFRDPVLNENGRVAFAATVGGPQVSASNHNDKGIWTNALSGTLQLVARTADAAPGVAGGKFESFTSYSLSGSSILLVAKLGKVGGLITSKNNQGIWLFDTRGLQLVLLKGQRLWVQRRLSTVQSFTCLSQVATSPDQPRSQHDGACLVRVDLADGRQALIQLNIGYPLAVLAVSGQAAPNYQNRAAFDSFGVPTYSGDNVGSAFKAKVHSRSPKQKLGTGVDLGVFARAPYGKMFLLTREGARAPGAGGLRFSSFDDPLMNDQFAIAFPASLDNAPSGLNKGIWWRQPGGQLQLVAIAGGQPAGVANGAAWSGFQSVALPDGLASGPVFTAKLYVPAWSEPNPAAITRSNNTGIWGVDSTGALWLLARTGSTINVGGKNRVIKTLTALSAVSGSCGQSRSYNSSGEVIYRAAFTDGGQAVIKVALP